MLLICEHYFLALSDLSSIDPVLCHFLMSLDTQDLIGMGESWYLWVNLSLYFVQVLFHMYVSAVNILRSVVCIIGYH